MNREHAAAPQPNEPSPAQPDGQPQVPPVAPAAAAVAAPIPAERWVIATEQSALLPLLRRPRGWRRVLVVTLPLIVVGVLAYAAQMTQGLGVTGMSNRTPWSLYIVNFVFFIGASAGGIVVASLAYALGLEHFKPVARLAEVTALTCLTLATIFITLDVGRPDRLWHLLRHGNLSSPLVWDVTSIAIYSLLAFALVYFSVRADVVRLSAMMPHRRRLYRMLALGRTDLSPEAVDRDHRTLHALALLSVPAAIAVHTVTAWILGLVKAQPGWHTAILAPMFIVSAVVSGIALTIAAAVVSRWALGVRIDEDVIRSLARILFFTLPVLGYLFVSEMITAVYPKEPEGVHVFAEMAFGRWGLTFWFTLCGLLGAFVLLAAAKRFSLRTIGLASFAVVLAVLAERWNIVIPTQTATSHLPYGMPGYTPSAVELAITAAAYAGGVLAYLVLTRTLPMVDLSVEREAHR
jgi:molybdopterin-containing oxidoreductase family membrane subunit